MKINRLFATLISAIALLSPMASYAINENGAPDMEFRTGINPYGGFIELHITALDNVVIHDIMINRGACDVFTYLKKKFPVVMQYSQQITLGVESKISGGCNQLREIIIRTDTGDWEYK